MTKLTYAQKLNILTNNENTLALWFRNTMSMISINMLFLILFKEKKYKYIFLVIPIASLLFFLRTMYQYTKKHDIVYNDIEGDEMNMYYDIGINNITFLVTFTIIIFIIMLIFFFKYIY